MGFKLVGSMNLFSRARTTLAQTFNAVMSQLPSPVKAIKPLNSPQVRTSLAMMRSTLPIAIKLCRAPPVTACHEQINAVADEAQAIEKYNAWAPQFNGLLTSRIEDLKYCSGTAMTLSVFLTGDGKLAKVAAFLTQNPNEKVLLDKTRCDGVVSRLTALKDFVIYGTSLGSVGHDWILGKENNEYFFFQSNIDSDDFYVFPALNDNHSNFNAHLKTDQEFSDFMHKLTDRHKIREIMPFMSPPQDSDDPSWRMVVASTGSLDSDAP